MKLTLPVTPQAYADYIRKHLGAQMLEDYDRFGGLCGRRFFYVRSRHFTTGNWRRVLLVSSAVGFYRGLHGQTAVRCLILPCGAGPVLLLALWAATLAAILTTGVPITPSLAAGIIVTAALLLGPLFFTPDIFYESESRLRALLRMLL